MESFKIYWNHSVNNIFQRKKRKKKSNPHLNCREWERDINATRNGNQRVLKSRPSMFDLRFNDLSRAPPRQIKGMLARVVRFKGKGNRHRVSVCGWAPKKSTLLLPGETFLILNNFYYVEGIFKEYHPGYLKFWLKVCSDKLFTKT